MKNPPPYLKPLLQAPLPPQKQHNLLVLGSLPRWYVQMQMASPSNIFPDNLDLIGSYWPFFSSNTWVFSIIPDSMSDPNQTALQEPPSASAATYHFHTHLHICWDFRFSTSEKELFALLPSLICGPAPALKFGCVFLSFLCPLVLDLIVSWPSSTLSCLPLHSQYHLT